MNIVIFDIDWQFLVSNYWAREASLWHAELSKDIMRVWLWALDCLGVSGLWGKCHPRGGGREEPGTSDRRGQGGAPSLWPLHGLTSGQLWEIHSERDWTSCVEEMQLSVFGFINTPRKSQKCPRVDSRLESVKWPVLWVTPYPVTERHSNWR